MNGSACFGVHGVVGQGHGEEKLPPVLATMIGIRYLQGT